MEFSKDELSKLESAKNAVSVDMLNSIEHGQEIELNDAVTLYKYTVDDIVVLVMTNQWREVYQPLIDNDKVIFEEI